jgi:predicted acetyltransferase
MSVSLRRASDADKPVIANLIQLYLYDMTEFMPFPVGSDGRFDYGFLHRFWRHPYFIMEGEEIAGFALVVDECPLTGRTPCWFMAEFFVLKAYRNRGVGKAAFDLALAAHAGPWHIAVPHANRTAQAFWGRALVARSAPPRDIHFDGDDWSLYAFDVERGGLEGR